MHLLLFLLYGTVTNELYLLLADISYPILNLEITGQMQNKSMVPRYILNIFLLSFCTMLLHN